jgi:hypothetical protein
MEHPGSKIHAEKGGFIYYWCIFIPGFILFKGLNSRYNKGKGPIYLRKLSGLIFIVVGCYLNLTAQVAVPGDGGKQNSNDTIAPKSVKINLADYKIKSPVIAASLSFVVPGAGQAYTGNYVKSGLILASEVALGLFAYNRNIYEKDLNRIANIARDSFMLCKDSVIIKRDSVRTATGDTIFDTTFVGVGKRIQYDFARFNEQEARYLVYQCITWAAGVYYFNILDAIRNTGYFNDDKPRSPSTAGWLSAVPGLALGQIYNGSLDKAGLIFMTQCNLAYMVYNYNTLMRTCENNLIQLNDPASRESKAPGADQLKSSWDAKHNDAFRNRNMYLWYSLGLYFYGIFDAVVDAHLHDSGTKMKLEPDLMPNQKQVGLNLKGEF